MALLVFALMVGGPLLVALASVLLVIPAGLTLYDSWYGVIAVVSSLGVVAVLGAAGTSAVYRWCFSRPPVRGAALLTCLLLLVFLLSHESTVALLGRVASGQDLSLAGVQLFIEFLLDTALFFGVAVAICSMIVLLVELPLRWIQHKEPLLSEGAFRMLRWVGAVLILVVSSSLLRDEGVLRLEATVRRALG